MRMIMQMRMGMRMAAMGILHRTSCLRCEYELCLSVCLPVFLCALTYLLRNHTPSLYIYLSLTHPFKRYIFLFSVCIHPLPHTISLSPSLSLSLSLSFSDRYRPLFPQLGAWRETIGGVRHAHVEALMRANAVRAPNGAVAFPFLQVCDKSVLSLIMYL
jgi:hypothetical protein